MKIKIINNQVPLTKENILKIAGSYANICYSHKNYDDFCNSERNTKIAEHCIKSGHHSIFDHINITFSLENIPKLIVLMLNNIGIYNTSEKSGRYTQFNVDKYPIYKKWIGLFEKVILNTNSVKQHIKDDLKLVNKLAMENARYFLPIDFETNLIYTISIRNLSYLYDALIKLIEIRKDGEWYEYIDLIKNFKDELTNACPFIEELKIFPKDGNDNFLNKIDFYKETNLEDSSTIISGSEDYDIYKITYTCSYACLGQLQRHRTTKLNTNVSYFTGYYIPPILYEKENSKYLEEYKYDYSDYWYKGGEYNLLADCVEVTETGTIGDFKLKALERLCSRAQLEICNITKKYIKELGITSFNKYGNLVAKCGTKKCLEPCKYGITGLDRVI